MLQTGATSARQKKLTCSVSCAPRRWTSRFVAREVVRGRSTMVLLSTDTNWRSCGAAPHATPPSPWPQYVVLQQKPLAATKRSGRQGPAEQRERDEPQHKPRMANVQRTRTQPVEPLSQRFFENLHTGPRRLGKTPLERSHGSPPACPPESGWSSLASSPWVAPLSARAPRAGETGAQPSDSWRAPDRSRTLYPKTLTQTISRYA